MLTHYCLTLIPDRPCAPRPEWAYRLYAALLEQAPAEFGARVHEIGISPISQYLDCRGKHFDWHVTLLGETAETALGPRLEQAVPFCLTKDQVLLTPRQKRKTYISAPEELFLRAAAGTGRHILEFRTASAFKSRGKYQVLPTSRLILQNLIQKWNGSFPDCPIEDEDGQGMEAMADGLLCRRFQLHDRTYFLKGNAVPGFVGTVTLENCLSGFHRELADALLTFAGYAGVGIKTSLGMGGVIHRTESSQKTPHG